MYWLMRTFGKMFVVYSCTVNFQLGVTSNFLAVSSLQYLPFSSGIYIFSAGIIFFLCM